MYIKRGLYTTIAIIIAWSMQTPCIAGSSLKAIVQGNLFNPDRKEVPEQQKPKKVKKKLPPKRSLPVLRGTIITDSERLAIVRFKMKGNRKRWYWDERLVYPGSSVGDYQIVAVEDKKVTLDFHGQTINRYCR